MIAVDRDGHLAVIDYVAIVAAHSMDTDWYAVDPGGRVARMSSGEEGAVPYSAHRRYWEELYEDIVIARVDALLPVAPDASLATVRRARDVSSDAAERGLLDAILAGIDGSRDVYRDWLEARDALPRGIYVVERELRAIRQDELPYEWDGVVRFASSEYLELYRAEYHYSDWRTLERAGMPTAVFARQIQQWAFDDYWNQGAITQAFCVERALEPSDAGFFEYACSFSGPYTRRAEPGEPVHIDALPEPLRAELLRLRVPATFATTEVIDPERWFDCQTY